MINIGKKTSDYLTKLGKNSVLQTLPSKSSFKGLALAPLKEDAVNLTSKVKKFNSQAEKLKDYYTSKGIPYLLPSEEWSSKKILETVQTFGENLDEMINSKTLNRQTLQNAVEKLAPEAKDKIVIKDFSDLKKDLKALDYDDDYIENCLNSAAALTRYTAENNTNKIYLNFSRLEEGRNSKAVFKMSAEHEVTHALCATFQNTSATNIFKNKSYKCQNQNGLFNEIFHLFEKRYPSKPACQEKFITKEKMAKTLGFESLEALHKSFNSTMRGVLAEAKKEGLLNFGSDKRAWKQFFKSLKDTSTKEKEAYYTNVRMREVKGNLNIPTTAELRPLFYEELGKFFEAERIKVNKQIPTGS